MRIRLTHPKYQVLAKTDEALILQGESVVTLFPDAVAECAVTISQNTIHVAALSKYNTVLHWYGNGSAQFQYQEVVTEKLPIRGLRLVTDSAGTPNLLYMQQSPKQTSWSLIQHSFLANEWSDPMRVTGNISSDPNHWQVCFGADQSLHLVYLSQEHDTLFYRAADMKTRTWTGAVPITREYAEYPQIFAAGYGLVVFWISHLEQGKVLRAVVQLGTWSKPYDLSPIAKDIFQPGIEFDKNQFRIMWMQSGKLWYTSYDQNWSQAEQLELDQRQFGYQTVLSGQGLNFGCCVMRVYYQRQIEVSPEKAEPQEPQFDAAMPQETTPEVTAEEPGPEKAAPPEPKPQPGSVPRPEPVSAAQMGEPSPAEQARKEAERRFFTEAFQLHLEWQSLKEQYTKILEEKDRLAEAVEAKLMAKVAEAAAAASAKQAENIELLSQRILAIREEVRSLRARSGFNQQNTDLDALQIRIEQLEAGMRAKASASQLQEIKTRIAKLEQAINPPSVFQSKPKQAKFGKAETVDQADKTKPEMVKTEEVITGKPKRRTIWQQIFSRL